MQALIPRPLVTWIGTVISGINLGLALSSADYWMPVALAVVVVLVLTFVDVCIAAHLKIQAQDRAAGGVS